MAVKRMTIDEVLRPLEVICINCNGKAKVYPDSAQGVCVCPKCSPNWLDSFARFLMNQEREKHGLPVLP